MFSCKNNDDDSHNNQFIFRALHEGFQETCSIDAQKLDKTYENKGVIFKNMSQIFCHCRLYSRLIVMATLILDYRRRE